MTTTTRSSSNGLNDVHNGLLTAKASDMIPMPTSTGGVNNVTGTKTKDCLDDDLDHDDDGLERAFVKEEEKFIDEEISSNDEDGRPIVDTEALEHRHLTVALVQSCVDQQEKCAKSKSIRQIRPSNQHSLPSRWESPSSSSYNSSPSNSEHSGLPRYGLRPRTNSQKLTIQIAAAPASGSHAVVAASASSTTESPSTPPAAPGTRKRGRPPTKQIARTNGGSPSYLLRPSASAVSSPPPTTITRNPKSLPASSFASGSSSSVPNPLLMMPPPGNSNPLLPPPALLLPNSSGSSSNKTSSSLLLPAPLKRKPASLASSSSTTINSVSSSSFSSATPATPVASNRTATVAKSSSVELMDHPLPTMPSNISSTIPSDTTTSAQGSVLTSSIPAVSSSTELQLLLQPNSLTASRGRVFSIDIDPEFDFADMALDSIQPPDFGTTQLQQQQPNMTCHPNTDPTNSNTTGVAALSIDLPTVVGGNGRNRAFSFEIFSFLDEPLPPPPPPSAAHLDISGIVQSSSVSKDDVVAMDIMPDAMLSTCSAVLRHCDHQKNSDYDDDDDAVFLMSQPRPQRPRGDSIIFDPVSFQDGGIHETNALTKIRSGSVASSTSLSFTSQGGRMDVSMGAITGAVPTVVGSSAIAVPATAATTAVSENTNGELVNSMSSQHVEFATVPRVTTSSMSGDTPIPVSVVSSSSTTVVVGAATASPPGVVSSSSSPFPMELLNKDGRIGIYLPDARKARIARFHAKRKLRIWRKRIKYDCRKKLADSRPRVKGRFVKRSDMDDEE